MYLLHFILLVLLGLLAPSTASAPGQMVDVATGNVGQDLNDRTVGNHLEARQGFPNELLLTYKLKCALEPDKTEKAPNWRGTQGRKNGFLKDSFCRRYYKCQTDGSRIENPDYRYPKATTIQWEMRKWCRDWCKCVIVDAPVEHPAYNYGCIDPVGGSVLGNYGSVSRDTKQPPGHDGFVMEAFEGPPRKD